MNVRLLPFLLLFVAAMSASAQTNYSGINYQAVVRNAAGDPVANQAVSLRLHIQEGLITGYVETHSTTTDAQGQVSVVWGQGTPVGGSFWPTFADVPWSGGGTKTYQVFVDITGGTNYALLGSGQFRSVPFALHALTSSGTGWQLNGNDVVNTNTGNVGIGTTTPGSMLQVGDFGGAVDRYITVATQGGNTQRSGIRLRHFNENNGYTIESDERGATLGLNILDHEASASGASVLFISKGTGNVGIGTTTPQSKLAVNGKITSKEVDVTVAGFPDYVFRDGYELMPLQELKRYIDEHGRLPKMPSEAEVVTNGLSLGAMNVLLVEKVEELTLQMIASEEQMAAMRAELAALRALVTEGLKK